MDLSAYRNQYLRRRLSSDQLLKNPFQQFHTWMEEACASGDLEPTAMSLCTASKGGTPSVRTVLLKAFDEEGFYFYSYSNSRKVKELSDNPQCALLFHWRELERQVTIEGVCQRISDDLAAEYFRRRPRESQISAWISSQGRPIANRQTLEERFERAIEKFNGSEIPVPTTWWGGRVLPYRFEFWQGGVNRLHDRFQYLLTDEGGWKIDRLAP